MLRAMDQVSPKTSTESLLEISHKRSSSVKGYAEIRGPTTPRNHIRILQTIVSGSPLVLGLRTRTWDPNVYVVFRAPRIACVVSCLGASYLPCTLCRSIYLDMV